MNFRLFFALLMCVGLLAGTAACSDDDDKTPDTQQPGGGDENGDGEGEGEGEGDGNENGDGNGEGEGEGDVDPDWNDDEELNSQDIAFENAVTVSFGDGAAVIDNPYADAGVAVSQDGGHVVITSAVTDRELTYVLRGRTDSGSVKIYGEYKFNLALNGVAITNPRGAAINIQCGKKVTVTVVDQTRNRLSDGAEYDTVEGEDMKGTFFSEGQLNFQGNGRLTVRGLYKHAICTDDYFRLHEGDIVVTGAVSDAVHAKDYARIDAGKMTLACDGDGIDCDGYIEVNGGSVAITTSGKKGHGLKCGDYMTVSGSPTLDVTVNGVASKCINSTGNLTVSGGTLRLTTTGDAYFDTDDNDTSSAAAIKCDADCLIGGGVLNINSSGSGGKGINVGGALTFDGGAVSVTTTGDQYVYDRNNDTAAKAIKSDGDLTVNAGTITIRTSKTEAEGLESKATLTINGGEVDIEAYDDAINASTHIEITGGRVYCRSEVNDAIDSNGTLSISGGTVIAVGSAQPEAGFDCDQSRFAITGGTILGIGGSTSTPTASACTQRSVVFNATSGNLGTVYITSGSDGGILTFTLPRTYSQQVTMLFSSPDMAANTSYTIYTGGTASGGTGYHGLFTGASYDGGSSAGTFTTSSMVSTVGSGNGPGGGPGRP